MKYIIVLLCFSSMVYAGSPSVTGSITEIRGGAHYGAVFTFKLSPSPAVASCNTLGSRGHFVINTSKSGGQETLSLVLTAYAAGKPVTLWGTGDCIVAGAYLGEEVDALAIQ